MSQGQCKIIFIMKDFYSLKPHFFFFIISGQQDLFCILSLAHHTHPLYVLASFLRYNLGGKMPLASN